MDPEILAEIEASAPRRLFGIGVLAALGGMLIYIAASQPPANLAWGAFLVGVGMASLFAAYQMARATRARLELTGTQLRSSDGTVIAEIDYIRGLDRGMFAFKPSNGFILRLKGKTPWRWRPGLWWSLGGRVGVGGVTSAAQTKAMAEIISAMIAERGDQLPQ